MLVNKHLTGSIGLFLVQWLCLRIDEIENKKARMEGMIHFHKYPPEQDTITKWPRSHVLVMMLIMMSAVS